MIPSRNRDLVRRVHSAGRPARALAARLPLRGAEALQQSRLLWHAGPGHHLRIELAVAAVVETRAPIYPDGLLHIGGGSRRLALTHGLQLFHPDLRHAAILGEERRHRCQHDKKEDHRDSSRQAAAAGPSWSCDFDNFSHSNQNALLIRSICFACLLLFAMALCHREGGRMHTRSPDCCLHTRATREGGRT